MANLLYNLDDYVRVTQTAEEEIVGRYDGVDYVFAHGDPVDVHKDVARHVFGFGLPEESNDPRVQDKTACLLRLGWLQVSGERKAALAALRKHIIFEEVPPSPKVLRLRAPEENTGLLQQEPAESASRVPSSPPLGVGGAASQPAPDNHKATLHLPAKAKG